MFKNNKKAFKRVEFEKCSSIAIKSSLAEQIPWD